jgi:hypothetical protein
MRAETEARSGQPSWQGSTSRRESRAARFLSAGLLMVAAAILAGWTFLAVAHVGDRYKLDHVSGVRMALAQYFTHGTLYPDLYDGSFYGGTRFMPLPIVLHGTLAELTGEYLVSGKLLAYGVLLALLAVMLGLLRAMRCPLPISLSLVAGVLVTKTGLAAGMNLRADILPLLLQLLAVATVAHTRRPRGTVAAGAFAALALVSKLSAVWAPLAICTWLVIVDRRRLVWFLTAYGLLTGALLGYFGAVTDNRLFENVFGLSTAGMNGIGSLLRGPYVLFHLLVDQATGTWALFPVVAGAAWLAAKRRELSIYLVSLAWCLVVLFVVLSDIGTGWNQLVDLVVLTALVVGELAGRLRLDPARRVAIASALALLLVWVNLTGLVVVILPDVRTTLASWRTSQLYSSKPLSGRASPATKLLSEDPYVPVSLGQRPVVLDPFMLQRLGRRDPAAVARLVERIRAREFDLVVLVIPLQPVDSEWWREMHFGTPVVEALADSYVFSGTVDGYHLYRPASTDGPRGEG